MGSTTGTSLRLQSQLKTALNCDSLCRCGTSYASRQTGPIPLRIMSTYTVQPATESPARSGALVRAAVLCALAVSVIGLALTWHSPQGVFHDPVVQLIALRQYVAGRSPTFNTTAWPSPDDLSLDTYSWVTWWPPGMGLLLLPFVSHGVRLATAVRALAMICYVVGSLGWAFWFTQFRIPRRLVVTLAAALPLSHYATTPLFQFYTESFDWACVPWVLLGALPLARAWQQRASTRFLLRSGLFGLALGLLYWLKYSAVFVSGGVLLFLAWLTVRDWRNRRQFRAPRCCASLCRAP